MTENKYAVWFLSAVLAAVSLNVLLVFLITGSRGYVETQGMVMSRRQMEDADRILSSCDYTEYDTVYGNIQREYAGLQEYQKIMELTENGTKKLAGSERQNYSEEQIKVILERFNYPENEVAARLSVLSYCLHRLWYALGYPRYVDQVVANAALMSEVSIFNDTAARRILKTGMDFYGHENIRVSAVSDLGVKELFADSITDVLALGMTLACALIYYFRCHAGASAAVLLKSRSGLFAAGFAGAVMLLYGTGTAAHNAVFHLGDLGRAVQSLEDFYTCHYMISVGTLILVRILFKTLACLILYLFTTGILFCGSRITAVLTVLAAVLAELFLDMSGLGISIYSALRAERFIMGYSRFNVFGEVLNAGWTMGAFLVCLLGASFYFAAKNISAELLLEKERREQAYFDEINSRYTETRLIRHDINNHLTAIAMLMDEGNIQEARRYLGIVSEQMDGIKPPVKTGSAVLDAVLFGKLKEAEGRGIPLELNFTAQFEGSGISDYDLCAVFGNLLDNAVEACGRLPDGEKGISLSVKKQEDMVCIYCENRYHELLRENGGFATTKNDRGAHGLGLKRIRRIAEKYNGTMEIHTENGLFSISVLFVL